MLSSLLLGWPIMEKDDDFTSPRTHRDGNEDAPANLFQLEAFGDKHFKRQKKGMLSSKKVSIRAMLQWQKGTLKSGLLNNAPKDSSKLFTSAPHSLKIY